MSFNAIRENKFLAKISKFTVSLTHISLASFLWDIDKQYKITIYVSARATP